MFFQTNGSSELGDYKNSAGKLVKSPYKSAAAAAAAKKKTASKKITVVKKATVKKPTTDLLSASGWATGQITEPMRRATITGTAHLTGYGDAVLQTSVRDAIEKQFAEQNWKVHNLTLTLNKDGWLTSETASISIAADVSNQFSNQAHLDQAYRIFNNAVWSGSHIFTQVDLNLNAPEKPNYSAPKTTTTRGNQTPKNSGGSSDGSGSGGSGSGGDGSGIFDSLLSNLGFGVGVSATTAIIVGGLFLAVMLKK